MSAAEAMLAAIRHALPPEDHPLAFKRAEVACKAVQPLSEEIMKGILAGILASFEVKR